MNMVTSTTVYAVTVPAYGPATRHDDVKIIETFVTPALAQAFIDEHRFFLGGSPRIKPLEVLTAQPTRKVWWSITLHFDAVDGHPPVSSRFERDVERPFAPQLPKIQDYQPFLGDVFYTQFHHDKRYAFTSYQYAASAADALAGAQADLREQWERKDIATEEGQVVSRIEAGGSSYGLAA